MTVIRGQTPGDRSPMSRGAIGLTGCDLVRRRGRLSRAPVVEHREGRYLGPVGVGTGRPSTERSDPAGVPTKGFRLDQCHALGHGALPGLPSQSRLRHRWMCDRAVPIQPGARCSLMITRSREPPHARRVRNGARGEGGSTGPDRCPVTSSSVDRTRRTHGAHLWRRAHSRGGDSTLESWSGQGVDRPAEFDELCLTVNHLPV